MNLRWSWGDMGKVRETKERSDQTDINTVLLYDILKKNLS